MDLGDTGKLPSPMRLATWTQESICRHNVSVFASNDIVSAQLSPRPFYNLMRSSRTCGKCLSTIKDSVYVSRYFTSAGMDRPLTSTSELGETESSIHSHDIANKSHFTFWNIP